MQIDPSGSRQLLELQLSNVNNQTSGSQSDAGSTADFANVMDGLLGTGANSTSNTDSTATVSKRSSDGLLWLQLGSTYNPDINTAGSSSVSNNIVGSLLSSSNTGIVDSGASVPTDYDL